LAFWPFFRFHTFFGPLVRCPLATFFGCALCFLPAVFLPAALVLPSGCLFLGRCLCLLAVLRAAFAFTLASRLWYQ
jgi:hypothetical protein